MLGMIIWLAIFFFIFVWPIIKRTSEAKKHEDLKRRQMQQNTYQAPRQMSPNTYQTPRQMPQNTYQTQEQRRKMTDADRARLEEYRQKKAAQGSNAYVPSKPVQPNQALNANQQRNMAQPDIVERAKANSNRYAGKDETLLEMEKEHGHSERVKTAVADYVEVERAEHRKLHEKPLPSVEEESCLGTIEDLMVKGYSGNLSFERDFIGEAQDMLASFTLQG